VDVDYLLSLRKTTHYALYIPALPKPPPNYKYVIVFTDVDVIAVAVESALVYEEIVNIMSAGNYRYVEWTEHLVYLSLFQDDFMPLSEPVYIFMVESHRQISESDIKLLISSVDWGTGGYVATGEVGISSKFILRFVSWSASIALVVTALRKFDIEL